jgi:hypothetical protein
MSQDLRRREISRKTGAERLHQQGSDLGLDLLAFWRWNASDLVSNATRGRLAEREPARCLRNDACPRHRGRVCGISGQPADFPRARLREFDEDANRQPHASMPYAARHLLRSCPGGTGIMKLWIAFLVTTLSLIGTHGYAQEIGAGPGTAEITVIPGGGMFFLSSNSESSFGNYSLGGTFTYNFNRHVGLEGEVGGTLGVTQNLALGGITSSKKTPDTLNYAGNVVFSASAPYGTVPYVTGGVGGLTLLKATGLAVDSNATFFTGNIGAGVKWYANNRVGFRGDYRFIMVRSSDTAPGFFGQENRYGHRVYGGLVLNVTP